MSSRSTDASSTSRNAAGPSSRGGAASDWLSPHKLMVASNTLRSLVCAILTGLVLFKTISLWHLVALAAAFGTLDAFFGPAVRAFIPAVLEKDQLIAGNSLMQSAEMLSKFVGPSLAGLVVASAGAASAFGADTLSFVFVTACLLSIKRKQADEAAPALAKGSLLTSIRDGLRYTLGEPTLRSLIIIVAVIEFAFAGPFRGRIALAEGQGVKEGAALWEKRTPVLDVPFEC